MDLQYIYIPAQSPIVEVENIIFMIIYTLLEKRMMLCTWPLPTTIKFLIPENIFIQEFMLRAPGDFVKVYIYGLSQCYNGHHMDINSFAHDLGMSKDMVENAFQYWERQGILKLEWTDNTISSIQYYNIKDVVYNKNYNVEKTLYKYKDFNQKLQ